MADAKATGRFDLQTRSHQRLLSSTTHLMPAPNRLRCLPANRVETYDLYTGNVRMVSTTALAPEMIPLLVPALERVCWVNAAQAVQHGTISAPPTTSISVSGSNGVPPIPVAELHHDGTREQLRLAQVVVGIDCHDLSSALFYGTEIVDELARTGIKARVSGISFLYDSRTDSPESLCAAVTTIKGSCCYEGACG